MVAHGSPTLKIEPSVPIKKPESAGFRRHHSRNDSHMANEQLIGRVISNEIKTHFLKPAGGGQPTHFRSKTPMEYTKRLIAPLLPTI